MDEIGSAFAMTSSFIHVPYINAYVYAEVMAETLPISWQRHFQFHGKGTCIQVSICTCLSLSCLYVLASLSRVYMYLPQQVYILAFAIPPQFHGKVL